MKIVDFIKNFNEKKIINTKINDHAVSDYLNGELNIRKYIPFREKRATVEIVAAQNIKDVNWTKKSDAINQYVSFVIAMLVLHTNLEPSEDPVDDYDMLAESGLLQQIIAEFKTSYDECEILLKMAVSAELEENNMNAMLGKFLSEILNRLDVVGAFLEDKLGGFDLSDIIGSDITQTDLSKLKGFLDRYNK